MMLEDLENALAEHAPAGGELASELPPLTIDGIPVSVDKMTQVRSSPTTTSEYQRMVTQEMMSDEANVFFQDIGLIRYLVSFSESFVCIQYM